MKLPELQGLIRRRVLVNFRVQPDVVQRLLPAPFKPKLAKDWAIAGICLIRLEQIRPRWTPKWLGLSSENAAHRIAVRWTDEKNQEREGVYIPRRDTNSLLNSLAGGRLFPGEHNRSAFDVYDGGETVDIGVRGLSSKLLINLCSRPAKELPSTSIFSSLEEASNFFKPGALGYSETAARKHLDGITLVTKRWEIQPLTVDFIRSSFFDDKQKFPEGSIEFDCALLMRDIEHSWQTAPDMPISNCSICS